MKIALCSKGAFSLEIGATKNRIELGDSLAKLGWETELIDSRKLGVPSDVIVSLDTFSNALKKFMIANSANYDVVLYEYDTLPFDRKLFNKNTLFVARPAILGYRLYHQNYRFDLKARLSNLTKKMLSLFIGKYRMIPRGYAKYLDYCFTQCDLIQIQNSKDQALLMERGFSKEKTTIIPNGITADRLQKFKNQPRNTSDGKNIVYVGTFDFRKGAMDFPFLFERVKKRFPDAKLRLLGTSGMFSTSEQVLKFFPKHLHSSIEIVQKFSANDLPKLLSENHIGIFPSYLESFGFGALEMMCAGLPVVAYDSPGPCDFILKDLLVPVGDRQQLTDKVVQLLENPSLLEEKGIEAQNVVFEKYQWEEIAKEVDLKYKAHLQKITG
jgi:glycosyltransferase involved in cell wall biosynthesis